MKIAVHWFRRDLRLDDNAALYQALISGFPVLPVFIFDTNILDELDEKKDKRVDFINRSLLTIQKQLETIGGIKVCYGTPLECFQSILASYDIAAVYTNHDYEPYARQRDAGITSLLLEKNIPFYTYKDQVIFERNEVMKDNGEPYTVYTPYSKKWKAKLNDFYLKPYPVEKYFGNFYKHSPIPIPGLEDMGFVPTALVPPPAVLNDSIAQHYTETRDIPGVQGTTRLSMHLRFGTISIRTLAADCRALNEKLLNELIWRDFYQMVLWHFPHVVNHSFHEAYDHIKWRNNEHEFECWCTGTTGYPIVDAGMRELNETGFMHNRVRMITASFLTKHLLIDWRWGEAYFAKKLLDYDLASNNGGWQWACGSGSDAAPYFRIFNPYLQTEKFDPKRIYIKKWVPEFDDSSYPLPIIEHTAARERCLAVYKAALKDN